MGHVKKVAICDIDGTLISGETQFFLLMFMARRGFVPLVSFLRIFGWFILYRLGWVQGSDQVRSMAYQVFSGWSQERFESLCRTFFDEVLVSRIRSHIQADLLRLRSEGYEVILASATLKPIAESCREHIGFGTTLATELEMIANQLTGKINGRAVYGERKLELVDRLIEQNGWTWHGSWAFSDHCSDLPLLIKAGTAIAVSPDRCLEKEARKRKWVIYD